MIITAMDSYRFLLLFGPLKVNRRSDRSCRSIARKGNNGRYSVKSAVEKLLFRQDGPVFLMCTVIYCHRADEVRQTV